MKIINENRIAIDHVDCLWHHEIGIRALHAVLGGAIGALLFGAIGATAGGAVGATADIAGYN